MRFARADSLLAFLSLASRNIARQSGRSAMTLSAIVFSVASLILAGGFVQDVFTQLAEAMIHTRTGHLQVSETGFFTFGSRSPERYLLDKAESSKSAISALPEVQDVMARISFSGLISNGRSDLPIVGEGVEPDREARLGTFLKVTSGRSLQDIDSAGIFLGQGVAKSLGLVPGATVTLLVSTSDGALNTQEFEVVGVFKSFSNDFDARAVRISLGAAQELLSTGGVNSLVVALKKTGDTDKVRSKLERLFAGPSYEVKTWIELNDFYEKTVELYKRQFGAVQVIIFLMALLSVVNTVNLSVLERVGEFGTMRALGNYGRDVMALVLTENLLLGLLGAGIGILVGIGLALAISQIGIPMPPPPNADVGYTAYIRIDPATVATAALVGLLATVLAAVPPALRVSRMPVTDQLRQNI